MQGSRTFFSFTLNCKVTTCFATCKEPFTALRAGEHPKKRTENKFSSVFWVPLLTSARKHVQRQYKGNEISCSPKGICLILNFLSYGQKPYNQRTRHRQCDSDDGKVQRNRIQRNDERGQSKILPNV